jgi:hypothetical protein
MSPAEVRKVRLECRKVGWGRDRILEFLLDCPDGARHKDICTYMIEIGAWPELEKASGSVAVVLTRNKDLFVNRKGLWYAR